jgi:hypothetical protein
VEAPQAPLWPSQSMPNGKLAPPRAQRWQQLRKAALPWPLPNPSVKGTPTSGLRPLVAAPYLER